MQRFQRLDVLTCLRPMRFIEKGRDLVAPVREERIHLLIADIFAKCRSDLAESRWSFGFTFKTEA